MATHYKKLPKEDVDLQMDMNINSAFEYEDNMDIRKKYRSIYKYSDFDSTDTIQLEQDALHIGRVCQVWGLLLTVLSYMIFFLTLPISGWFCIKTVHNYERLVIFRLGRLKSTKGPGMVLVLPCIDSVNKVDLRMKAFSIPPQKILTADNAAIEVGADVYYRIHDAILSISRIKDLDMSTRVLSQTLLQTNLAKQTLADIESSRHATAQILLEKINEMTKAWGMEVGRVEISQIKVIKGPCESGCQAQNLLNMVTPALFPAGTHAPMLTPQETSCSPAQLFQMTAQHVEQAACSKALAPAMDQGPAVLDMDKDSCSSFKPVEPNKPKFTTTLNSPHDVIKAVSCHLGSNLVKEFGTLYKFIISGNGGGTFYLDLKNGTGSADEGEPPSGDPDVTLTMNMDVLRGILKGESSAFSVYMTGDLVIDGDVHAATQLAKLVDYIN